MKYIRNIGRIIVKGGLVALAVLAGTVALSCRENPKSGIESSVYEMTYKGRPVEVTRVNTKETTNLRFVGVGDKGDKQTLYAFDRNKDGEIDEYGFGFLRAEPSSAFYRLSNEEIAPYLNK